MLALKSNTDPAWVQLALANLDAVLVDHAHCEHKAAVTALALVSRYSDDPELVIRLSALAAEEASHLGRVARLCHARNLDLGHPDQDLYVKELLREVRSSPLLHRVDRLLVCALIEARSCERLKLLSEHLEDAELAQMYDELWRCEAGHHTLFADLAVRTLTRADPGVSEVVARRQIEARLAQLAETEATILARLPLRAAIH